MSDLRIAWFSQFDSAVLEGSGSKGEYFSRLVLPYLRQKYNIDCFGEEASEVDRFEVYSYKSFYKLHQLFWLIK